MAQNKGNNAIDINSLVLYYQPRIDVRTEQIVGMDAVICANDPELGMLAEDEFTDNLSEGFNSTEIRQWALAEACRQNSIWQKNGYNILPISVKVSAFQLEETNFTEKVIRLLRENELAPEYLEIMLACNQKINNYGKVTETIGQLKSMGIGFGLSKYGNNYEILKNIKNFSVDTIKIDKSFAEEIESGEGSDTIHKMIINRAKALGSLVVVEGVETSKQAGVLENMGCNVIQGSISYDSFPPAMFEKLLSRRVVKNDKTKKGATGEERLPDICNYLDSRGIRHSNSGYEYLLQLIQTGIDNPSVVLRISDLYSIVGEANAENITNIERSVRYSLKNAGETNKEFIKKAIHFLTVSEQNKKNSYDNVVQIRGITEKQISI